MGMGGRLAWLVEAVLTTLLNAEEHESEEVRVRALQRHAQRLERLGALRPHQLVDQGVNLQQSSCQPLRAKQST